MMNLELTLTDRMYVCKTCGMIKDRDLKATINMVERAIHHDTSY